MLKKVMIMRKYIVLALILALVASFIIGLYVHKLKNVNEKIAFETEYNNEQSKNVIKKAEGIIKETASSENKTTPNTKIIEKKYYNDCKHLVQEEQKITNKLVNKTESEFQIEYIGWEIQRFTPNEIVVYKEINDYCDEHYVLKDVEGEIIVYKLDKQGKIRETVKETGIQTKYLSEIDLEQLSQGIKVYGNKNLSQAIEDFE